MVEFQVLDRGGQPQRGDAAVEGAADDLEFQAGQVLAQALVGAVTERLVDAGRAPATGQDRASVMTSPR